MSTGLQRPMHQGLQHPFRQTYDSGLPPPFHKYRVYKAFDEMFGRNDRVRPPYRALYDRLLGFPAQELQERKASADLSFMQQGVTFTVYGEGQSTERILPHDLIPRILSAEEWTTLDQGLKQRVHAINLFLEDIYHEEKILKDRIVPRELIYSCPQYNRAMRGLRVPGGTYVHVVGTDLIRVEDGSFAVLEDNLRVPSGVSYMLANRAMTKRVMPHLLRNQGVRPVDHYCRSLLHTLIGAAPEGRDEPCVVVLTPGVYNSAYYEHAMLAREMGVELVEGRDLIVHDNIVYARTTSGLHRVDVIYRRLDDAFIDPVCFRPDSTLGVAGLFNAYRAGNVTLANAVGTGVADDKAVYAFIPEIIRYYLKEDPILPNIPTFLCGRKKEQQHVLENLNSMVVKATGEAGGYGMLIGPQSNQEEREEFRRRILANPRNYIAQPTIQLSQAPCFIEERVVSRHVDLRPFVLYGEETTIVPGGLTRVALREGSLVVNSSQGGGSKDTWVLSQASDAKQGENACSLV